MLSDLLFRLRALFRRRSVESELDDELRFHREQQLDKYRRAGLSEMEAQRRIRMEFGGIDQVKEECRDARGVRTLETFLQDARYGLRLFRRSPGFTAAALLTLTLGIGANTAIFSVLYGILLRPLPYRDASRLVVLNETTPRVGMVSVSFANYTDWRAQNHSFSDMAVVAGTGFSLSGLAQPEIVSALAVSSNFLSLLGTHPILGRDFSPSEDKPGTAPVVLLSYPFWQSRFGGDRNITGRTVTLDGRGFTIAGVLPPVFRWFERIDLMEPIGVWAADNKGAYAGRGERGDTIALGRLAPGVSMGQGRSEMEGIAARLARAYPESNDQFGVMLRPVRDVYVDEIRLAVLVLFGAVTFVLLIACANVANLFLMRGAGRAREMALRIAIGAGRGRVIAQMLAESFLLTALGGAAGLALALVLVRGIAKIIPAPMLGGARVDLSFPALLFAAGVVALAAFIFGLAPALHATKADVQPALKEGGRTSSIGRTSRRWRSVLVVTEVSLALVLLAGAGLMMKSLYRLLAVDAGIRTGGVLTARLSLRPEQYTKPPAVQRFWDETLRRVRALPGVENAALGLGVPLTGDHWRTDITVEGMPIPKPGSFPHPDVHVVSPDYAKTLEIAIVRGREFTDHDTKDATLVALINEHVAQQLFPHRDPIGARFMFGRPPTKKPEWRTIVGVVRDTKMYGLANPSRLEVYVPLPQNVEDSMTLLVKSPVDPAALTSAIRGVIASLDKDQPVTRITTMRNLVNDSISPQRLTFLALASFSALALILAATGIYGVIAYSVAQRTQEIGIRMALGAQPADVIRMVIAQGLRIATVGVAIGITAAFALTRLMEKLLFSVSAADPATFAAVTIGLLLIALFASYIPARRTLRTGPMHALRCE